MRRVLPAALAVLVAGPAAGVLTWAVLRLASVHSRPAYLVGVGVAALAVALAVRQALAPVAPVVASVSDEPDADRRNAVELITLEHRLAWGSVDAERFESRVRPLLVEITAERLRLRHGVDHTRDPDRAHHIVGDHLWHLMTRDPRRTPPSHRELRRIVDQIERI